MMDIPESVRFTVGGFSGKRLGYVLAMGSFALVPAHSFASCEVSGLLCVFAVFLLMGTWIFSLMVPRGTEQRLRPVAWAFVALVVNSLCTH